MRLYSYKKRPVELGPFPLETLKRQNSVENFDELPQMTQLSYENPESPLSISNSMASYATIIDALRNGEVASERTEIPNGLLERANHLKAASYFLDVSQAACCKIPKQALLDEPFINPKLATFNDDYSIDKVSSFAVGIESILETVQESVKMADSSIEDHAHAIVLLVEYPRDPKVDEPGADWIVGTQEHRAAIRAAEVAVCISNYLRIMGFKAKAHTATSTDLDFHKMALHSGLVEKIKIQGKTVLSNPYVGLDYGLAIISTDLELAQDLPLATRNILDRWRSHGPKWWLGKGTLKSKFNNKSFSKRNFSEGHFPVEKLNSAEETTTFIDKPRVARVPKRTDLFARGSFGDLGKNVQKETINGRMLLKNPFGFCTRFPLAAMSILQSGVPNKKIHPSTLDPKVNANAVKAALYFLGADMVGISEAPDWVWYSHGADGKPIEKMHKYAISILIDQGHETMEGASGDDWISGAQSMRAYMRSAFLGGIVAEQMRSLGYSTKMHSALDGEVLQPPLLLMSGLGEVSRIGEIILNPFLGPRMKSGVITTDMPLQVDKPIDFGLQKFCENCNKCARECPSGAITAGPKKMFNGYEIWKSDAEKCGRYRITNPAGSMCGRCMKTCPWNLEGLFKEAPFRWMAMKMPSLAKWIAKLDDKVGNGSINPVKKWWWDIDADATGKHIPAEKTNKRELKVNFDLKYEDQTLACYPANVAPAPYPVPQPIDREQGITTYRNLLSPEEYKEKLKQGQTENLTPQFKMPNGPPPVISVQVTKKEQTAEGIYKFEFQDPHGKLLPEFEAGAHIDVIIAPQFVRQYSLAGDPADRTKYVLGVLGDPNGRGGSMMMQKIIREGKKIAISRPRNHFPLNEQADHTLLMAGGIGVTPMIAMAHRLHHLNKSFKFYYCVRSSKIAGFKEELKNAPWADRVAFHFDDENMIDLKRVLKKPKKNTHLYTCGPSGFMDAVLRVGAESGWPEETLHKEYFSVPESEMLENHDFYIELTKSNKKLLVPADRTITDVLEDEGVFVETKCSEGICGVCTAEYSGAEVEHRDFVLSGEQRKSRIVLCSSRAKNEGDTIKVDL